MPGSRARARAARAPEAAVRGARAERLYHDYGVRLYRQALLAVDDAALAEQAVLDVLVPESFRPAPSADGVSERGHDLAVAVYRRCREMIRQDQRDHPPGRQPSPTLAGCPGPCRLSWTERGALGLVLFGGLRYAEVSRELAISPRDMAVLLHGVLHKLATARAGRTDQVPTSS